MKFKVLIDKNTVVKNSNDGNSDLIVCSPPTYKFEIEINNRNKNTQFLIKNYCDKTSYHNTFMKVSTVYLSEGEKYIVDDWIDRNKSDVISYSLEMKCHHGRVRAFPQPPLLFNYLPTEVECSSCHAKFKHTFLKEEEEYDNTNENVCPICGCAWCCELEYQSIEEIIGEINLDGIKNGS